MIQDKVIEIIVDIFEIKMKDITEDSNQNDIENWDSIGHLRLIMALEDSFNIKFLTSEIQGLDSVRKIIDLIKVRGNE